MSGESFENIDSGRRRFLTKVTSAIGGVGAVYALAPFVGSWFPSAKAQALGAPVKIDISRLEPGAQLTVEWRGQPIWVIRRSGDVLSELKNLTSVLRDPESQNPQQPNYAQNVFRSIKEEFLVLVGLCTHLGCVPTYRPDKGGVGANWPGGFYCPCHGSKFDMAGRVYKGVPAPTNLVVPPHKYLSDSLLVIGEEDSKVT